MKSSGLFSILFALLGFSSIRIIEAGYTCGDPSRTSCPSNDATECISFCTSLQDGFKPSSKPCPPYSFRKYCKEEYTEAQCWDWCLSLPYFKTHEQTS